MDEASSWSFICVMTALKFRLGVCFRLLSVVSASDGHMTLTPGTPSASCVHRLELVSSSLERDAQRNIRVHGFRLRVSRCVLKCSHAEKAMAATSTLVTTCSLSVNCTDSTVCVAVSFGGGRFLSRSCPQFDVEAPLTGGCIAIFTPVLEDVGHVVFWD